jgi:hypothetical protein
MPGVILMGAERATLGRNQGKAHECLNMCKSETSRYGPTSKIPRSGGLPGLNKNLIAGGIEVQQHQEIPGRNNDALGPFCKCPIEGLGFFFIF